MVLSKESIKIIEDSIGLPYDELIDLDIAEEVSYVENKIGKKLRYPQGYKIRTIAYVTKYLRKIH